MKLAHCQFLPRIRPLSFMKYKGGSGVLKAHSNFDKSQTHGPHREMYTELECAICYLTYNAGRRCPRELHCKHTFCESCLLALSRDTALTEAHRGPDRAIVCPLCRHTTSISAEEKIRAELRVDERAMEQLLVTGVLLEPEEEEPEEGSTDTAEEETPSESSAEDSDLSEGDSSGRLRRTMRKVWRKISGKNARQTSGNNLTDMSGDDMRNFALMACYMF